MKSGFYFIKKPPRFKTTLFAILIQIILIPGFLSAQTFIVGVQNFEEYLPYSTYQNSDYSGFNRELLDFFASLHGYEFVYRALPIKRLYNELIEKKIDFKYPDSPQWSKELKTGIDVTYSEAIVEYIDGVIVKKEKLGNGMECLKILGMIGGYSPFVYLDLINEKKISIKENRVIGDLLRQVNFGRVDGAYLNIMVSQYYIDKTFDSGIELMFDPDLPHSRGTRHLSSILHPDIIAKFNTFLIDYKDEIDALKSKYNVILDY